MYQKALVQCKFPATELKPSLPNYTFSGADTLFLLLLFILVYHTFFSRREEHVNLALKIFLYVCRT